MAVITRYIVVRNGVEQDRVFEVKKEAEAFDKMLEAAENLAEFIKSSDLEMELDPKTIDAVALVLAKNGPEVTRILKGVKPFTTAPSTPAPASGDTDEQASKTAKPAASAKSGGKRKGAK